MKGLSHWPKLRRPAGRSVPMQPAVRRLKLPNKPRSGLPCLLLELIQPFFHPDELLHLRLIVLPEHPHVGVAVHPLGLLRERLRHVRVTSQPLPYLLRSPQGPMRLVLALALVA